MNYKAIWIGFSMVCIVGTSLATSILRKDKPITQEYFCEDNLIVSLEHIDDKVFMTFGKTAEQRAENLQRAVVDKNRDLTANYYILPQATLQITATGRARLILGMSRVCNPL